MGSDAMSKAAMKKDLLDDSDDQKACDKQKAEEEAAKAAKAKKVSDFAAMVKDKTSDMEWLLACLMILSLTKNSPLVHSSTPMSNSIEIDGIIIDSLSCGHLDNG